MSATTWIHGHNGAGTSASHQTGVLFRRFPRAPSAPREAVALAD